MQTWKPERLTEARESRGLTRAGLAKALGVSKSAVTQWEKGVTAPRGSHLARLAQVLGKPAGWFYGVEEEHVAGSVNAPPFGSAFEEWERRARERLDAAIEEARRDWEERVLGRCRRGRGKRGKGRGG